jgi:hypothetical protein
VFFYLQSQRSPAWCDRILLRSVSGFPVRQLSLSAALSIGTSDHKPVVSTFEIDIPNTPQPIDRKLGETVIRVHGLRAEGLRAPKEKQETDPSAIAAGAKDIDPYIVFNSSMLSKPIQTQTQKKTNSPHWSELPPAQVVYNDIGRIKQTLIYVRVCNNQAQDAVIGRAVVSLMNLQLTPADAEKLASLYPESDISTATQKQREEFARGKPHTLQFQSDVTYAGVPAGSISGSVTVMWKQERKA